LDSETAAQIGSLYIHDTAVAPTGIKERYDVLSELGRGGMGIVYKVHDRITEETVALKVLKPEIAADPGAMERFKNELRLGRRITHNNVCRTYEFSLAAGCAYITMEFVDGESLRNVIARFGGLPVRKAIQIALQICSGLREAHNQGIVHRDLKPENIMIDSSGNAKIMDFGIARLATTALTQGTVAVGTPAYMAPEQVEGKNVDARTDIYALGLVLYEMFTGRPAFVADTPVAMLVKQFSETPLPPRKIEPTIPPRIEDAIIRCLEKSPGERFPAVDNLITIFEKANREDFLQENRVVLSAPPKTSKKSKLPEEGNPHSSSIDRLVFEIEQRCPQLKKEFGSGTVNFRTPDSVIAIGVYKDGKIWTALKELGDARAARLRTALSAVNIDLPPDKVWSFWKRGREILLVHELDPVATARAIERAL